MYLSRVRVAPEGLGPKALQMLVQGDAYGNHQLLWRLFPDDHAERPFLFRQELERDSHTVAEPRGLPLFYVLSTAEPRSVPGLLDCESRAFEPRLRTGQCLAFRLRANPVVARREEGRRRSRHHDVLMDAKRQARHDGVTEPPAIQAHMDEAARRWLGDESRSDRAGYRLPAVPQVSGYRQHAYRRRGREIRFSSVDYEGIIEVTSPERFRTTLAEGIGRSRAFGCGMWMIRPV
ncbi:type I-E CRISPR-associated protein Cas6/Cse3/CasE [Arhodomonas aquaeolei]|uniref:type I-E CRISPR-associated protein Cas6/Cse3/CasE n=1 Tax=Arhodomonas aquaeolei TaxID=2369 RepID=UPI000476D8FD|nr:type I-E CRISPR-associated protein Cas6/Cse3/CasE [Arhodomonas aquaeolei]